MGRVCEFWGASWDVYDPPRDLRRERKIKRKIGRRKGKEFYPPVSYDPPRDLRRAGGHEWEGGASWDARVSSGAQLGTRV